MRIWVKMIGLTGLLGAALLALSACATLSKSECLTADWEQLGISDGRAGLPASQLAEHGDACSKHGVVPDVARYSAGRSRGLSLYCTPDSAFEQGMAGNAYRNVCPIESHEAFVVVHHAAAQVDAIDQRISDAEGRISTLIFELSKPGLSAEDISSRQRELNGLNEDIRGYNRERRTAENFARTILERERSRRIS